MHDFGWMRKSIILKRRNWRSTMKAKKDAAAQILFGATILFLALPRISIAAEATKESAAEKQRKCIAILQSDAPPQDKAIPCKQLAIYGNKEAVPALAPLLANKDLASWARIALEAIPGPEADEALRAAVPKLQGDLLIGAINSIGVRRDAKAVDTLAGKLADADVQIVAAAAAALGKIGGTRAAKVLNPMLASARNEILPAIAEGCILCAERFLTDGKFADATHLYDAVRNAEVPMHKQLEATRGAILARQSAGLPLLLEQLRSPSKAKFTMALRTARELKGREVTEAIGAEFDHASADHQVMLLLAISDRHDEAVFPRLLQAAQNSSKPARAAALGLLDRYGDVAAVPVLLTAAADADADLAQPAKATLTRMEGKPVDTALLKRLPDSTGRTRQVIIELAALRRIEAAVPGVLSSVQDGDPGVRRAAFTTLTTLGSERVVGDLVAVLSKTQDADDREGIEGALASICGRTGTKCLPQVLPLTKNNDASLRKIGLRALATIGGPEALAAVTAAIEDRDQSVQDEAVGTLATWPNNWPEDAGVAEPLLKLAKSGRNASQKAQGARGYLLHLQESKKLSNADKLDALDRLLPSLQQPQEKRLAIATLSSIPTAKALEKLEVFAADPALAEEACLGIVKVATAADLKTASKDLRQKALQTAFETSKNDSTKQKAGTALKAIQ
jgi:HEAT repeat protein